MTDVDSMADVMPDAPPPRQNPSQMSDDALYVRLKDWFLKDSAHSEEWRDQARKDFDFVAGDQWEPNAFQRMVKDEKRVPVTFNKTNTFIKMVAGLEVNGRHEIVYLPRGIDEGEIVLNEGLSQASKWMGQQCDAEDEQSTAFRDMATCGMGWTEDRLDTEDDEDGMYLEESIDPLTMYWDRTARKKNLKDSQRRMRVKKMRLEDARAFAESLGADVADEDLDASWAIGVDRKAVKPYEDVRLKTGPGNAAQEGYWEADPNSEVHIVQFQWWERETYHRVAHPQTGEEVKLSPEEFKVLITQAKKANVQIKHVRQTRKVFKQAFVGGKVLSVGDLDTGRFTLQCMTGELHRSKGTWFGLVALMRDPQMWSNKMFSQVLHILNTTAKGGIMAEKGAFPDIKEAQKTFARPDAITIVEDGAITKGRIMAKPGAGLATPFMSLLEYSDKSFYSTTGLNIEIMGMRDAQQPGVLEAQRKQAGMTILATLFDSRRLYLKEIGRIRLHYIQNNLSDGRLMRIEGPNGYQAVRLMKDRVAGKFDVEVEDAPTSADVKNQTWQMLMQLAPFFRDKMTPSIASIFLDASPLPTQVANQLKQAMQAPNPMVQQKQAIGNAMAQSKIESDGARAEQARAAARRDDAASAKDIATAVLDIAQAGGQFNAQQAADAEAQLLSMLAPKVAPASMGGPFAVVPEQAMSGGGQMPTPPQLPVFGQTPPRTQLDPALLNQIMAAIRQNQAALGNQTAIQ
jgi:hypothetical protein